jgi:hypothetical protein
MEYYDGVTLEDLLEQHPIIPADMCLAVILNVCYGLEAAHAVNLVHRDIKPANVILTRSGGVKVADFGLARAIDNLQSVTQHGKVIGTPAYMSPEQTRGDKVGTQSDIFSLGVVAYELTCGQRPFDGRNYAEVVNNIQTAEPAPIADTNPLVAANFSRIFGRMLGKEPNERYLHIAETVLDLEEAVDAAGFKRDRRTLGRYLEDPPNYLASFNRMELERLRANPPSGPGADVLYHQCVLQLDPTNQESKAGLKRLNAKDPTGERGATAQKAAARSDVKKRGSYDPAADYKVYLDSIDMSQETAATFALKLSMRIRSPLPRVMAIVNNMPAVVGGRLPVKKAKSLARIIDDLGGVARIEVHRIDESTGSHGPRTGRAAAAAEAERSVAPGARRSMRSEDGHPGPSPNSEVVPPEPDLETTVEHHPINPRTYEHHPSKTSQPVEKRKCPKCGWDEDAEAKFCSICLFNFNKTEQLALARLRGWQQPPNPLVAECAREIRGKVGLLDRFRELPTKFRELPTNLKYGGLAAIIVLLLLIVFGR